MNDNPKHLTVRLRVPPELRDKIAASSEKYNRSMNADMVVRLEDSFAHPLNLDDIPLENMISSILKRLNTSELYLKVDNNKATNNE